MSTSGPRVSRSTERTSVPSWFTSANIGICFTDPEGPFSQAGLLQLLRRALHNHEAVSGDPFWAFPYGRELFLERHFVVLSF